MIIAAYLAISVCVLLLPRGISFSGINGALLKTSQIRGRNDECYNNAKSLFQLSLQNQESKIHPSLCVEGKHQENPFELWTLVEFLIFTFM